MIAGLYVGFLRSSQFCVYVWGQGPPPLFILSLHFLGPHVAFTLHSSTNWDILAF